MPRVDVVVAGAGPAGTAAAIALRRAGRTVTVVDKATFPRDKCCGDGLTAAALRRLEHLGLDPRQVSSWEPVHDVTVVGAGGTQVALPFPGPGLFAASARRADLDAALVAVARRAGAEVMEGSAVAALEPAAGAVSVHLAGGAVIEAPYLVAADGMWSPVRHLTGAADHGYLGEWQAGRHYLRTASPAARRLWVWFEPDMIPGYAWSFPLAGGIVNAGYGVLRSSHHQSLKGQRIDWSERPRIAEVLGSAEEVGPWRAWPIPARIGTSRLSALGGRVLLAGDAAGACDPMTGEGIAQALETGELAARVISRAGPDRPERAAGGYRRTVRAGLAVDDHLSRALARVLARPHGSDRALAIVDRSEWRRRQFARWMFEDYPRALVATPHRWRPGTLGRPGAYPGWPEERAERYLAGP